MFEMLTSNIARPTATVPASPRHGAAIDSEPSVFIPTVMIAYHTSNESSTWALFKKICIIYKRLFNANVDVAYYVIKTAIKVIKVTTPRTASITTKSVDRGTSKIVLAVFSSGTVM